jgi:hypothetical protein
MIEFKHPRMERERSRNSSLSFEDLQHITARVDNRGLHPSERVVKHFDTINAFFPGPGISRNMRGSLFEWLIYDAVVAHGVRIVRTNIDLGRGRNAEADLVSSNDVAILAKTSLRERWKQPDRDAHIMEMTHRGLKTYVVYLREKDGDDIERIERNSERIQSQMFSKAIVLSVYEEDLFAEMIRAMGGTT